MILYLDVETKYKDLYIDCLEIKTEAGEIITVDWDETGVTRHETGFYARYKGVYFNDEYANGKLSMLGEKIQIHALEVYTESTETHPVTITGMEFEENLKSKTFPVNYTLS